LANLTVIVPKPMAVYSESIMLIAVTVIIFRNVAPALGLYRKLTL